MKGILEQINLSHLDNKQYRKSSSAKFRSTQHSSSFIKTAESRNLKSRNQSNLLNIVQSELDLQKSRTNLNSFCEIKRNSDKQEEMRSSFEDQIRNLKENHNDIIHTLKSDYENQIKTLKNEQDKKIDHLNQKYAAMYRDLNIRLNDQASEYHSIIAAKDEEANQKVKQQAEADKLILKKESEKLIDVIETMRRKKKEEVEQEVEERLETTQLAQEEKERILKITYQQHKEEECSLIKADYDKVVEDLKSEIEDMQADIKTMKIEHAKLVQAKRQVERTNNDLKDEVFKVEMQSEDFKNKIRVLNTTVEDLQNKNINLQDIIDSWNKREHMRDREVATVINNSNQSEQFKPLKKEDLESGKISTVTSVSTLHHHHVVTKLNDKIDPQEIEVEESEDYGTDEHNIEDDVEYQRKKQGLDQDDQEDGFIGINQY